eukprot:scpid13793/ scgid16366/ Putative molluscan insulin-related peptide(s) receptor; Putative molluscan insulin-related peptide(s) receptor alpha chain; Putative molluscan insulin-related peptide(s) receptor beta chain
MAWLIKRKGSSELLSWLLPLALVLLCPVHITQLSLSASVTPPATVSSTTENGTSDDSTSVSSASPATPMPMAGGTTSSPSSPASVHPLTSTAGPSSAPTTMQSTPSRMATSPPASTPLASTMPGGGGGGGDPDPDGGGGGDPPDGDGDGDDEGDDHGDDDVIPTFPAYTGAPRKNWTVCSTLALNDLQAFAVFRSYGCEILNGSLVVNIGNVDVANLSQIQLPSLRHVTSVLAVLLATPWTVRDVFPNLIAVHGQESPIQLLERFKLFVGVPYEYYENITMLVSNGAIRDRTDGIAVLRGRIAYYTKNRTVYSSPSDDVVPIDCDGQLPMARTGVSVDVNMTANTTVMCCDRRFDGTFLCPYDVDLSCLSDARLTSQGNRTGLAPTMATSDNSTNATFPTLLQNSTASPRLPPSSSPPPPSPAARYGTPIVCTYYAGEDLNQCVDACPSDTSLFAGIVCVKRCPTIVTASPTSVLYEPYFSAPSGNSSNQLSQCQISCPPFFQADSRSSTCQSCSTTEDQPGVPCMRACPGIVVKSLTQLCGFVGCTDVRGDLILSINNPGLIPQCLNNDYGITTLNSAMIKALGSVRRIYGLLLIIGNICMYNLNFFRNLEDVYARRTIAGNYSILIKDNPVLTDVYGLSHLAIVGRYELDILSVTEVLDTFRIEANSLLCPSEINRLLFSLLGDHYIGVPIPPFRHLYFNSDPSVCPVTRFPINVTGTSETSVTVKWSLPQPQDNTTVVYSQYLYFVETRNSVDPHLRAIIQDSGRTINTDFSCAARLEPWSVISVPANASSYTVTNLRVCSEYAFEIDAIYNHTSPSSPGLNSGNSSHVILGRPKTLANLPSPGNVRVQSANTDTITISWTEPTIACQAIGTPFTYRVFWAQIETFAPASDLTLAACGQLCLCSAYNYLDSSTQIGQLMATASQQLNGSFSLSSGFAFETGEHISNLITPAGCNNDDVSGVCCPEGLHIHVKQLGLTVPGLFDKQHSALTRGLNFTVKRNMSSLRSTYVFSVQAYHGDPSDDTKLSNNPWAVAANVSQSLTTDALQGLSVSRSRNATGALELSWTEAASAISPAILYQVLVSARFRTYFRQTGQFVDSLDPDVMQCLQAYCSSARSPMECINVTLTTQSGNAVPVALVINVTSAGVSTVGGKTSLLLRDIKCADPQAGNSLRDILFQVRMVSVGGCGPWSAAATRALDSITASTSEPSSSGITAGEIVGIVIAPLAALLLLLMALYSLSLYRSKKKSARETAEIRSILERIYQSDRSFVKANAGGKTENDYEGDLTFANEMDEWEVDLKSITLLGELGRGNFGTVYEGRMKQIIDDKEEEVKVAVKTVKEGSFASDRRDFLAEACVMKGLNSPNLVNLVGLVTQGEAYAIMEFMPHGDLKHYLRAIRPEKQAEKGFDLMVPSESMFYSWASDIAKAMQYLSSKRIIHRDLAARNVMIDEKYSLRVGDFGLARDIYITDYYRRESQTPLPLRWLAPESIRDGVFSHASDIWAYGIVLYEVATLAQQPYVGLNNEDVVRLLIKGGCMDPPIPAMSFPNDVIRVMTSCWKHSPEDRPTFDNLVEQLTPDDDFV